MDRHEILNRLSAFPYDRGEYWVVTGGAMVLYGIREQAADIDLGCTREMADRLEKDGFLTGRTKDGKRRFTVGGSIEVFEEWLEDSPVTLDGFRVMSISGLIRMKQTIGREKDLKDIEMINAFLRSRTGGREKE